MSLQSVLVNQLFNRAVILNQDMAVFLDHLFDTNPALAAGLAATKGWAFCHPPELYWPSLGTKAGKDMQYILKQYYQPFRWKCYIEKKKKGLVVWTKRRIGEFDDVPEVVDPEAGFIRMYYDVENKKRVYQWFWHNRPEQIEPDNSVFFKVWSEPSLSGEYRSPAVNALRTCRMADIASISGERAMFQGSHMPYFLVHQPPPNRPGDEKLRMDFADDDAIGADRAAHNRQIERAEVDKAVLRKNLDYARALNNGLKGSFAGTSTPLVNVESQVDRERREGHGVMDRLVELDPYWNIANPAPPVLLVDPLEYEKRADQVAASVVDFPLSMVIEQHAQHAGNFNAQIAFARDRMKNEIVEMSDFLVEVFLECEARRLKKMYLDSARARVLKTKRELTEEEAIEMHNAFHDLEFKQVCTPLITFEDLKACWEYGLMTQETFAEHAFHLFGISDTEIKITKLKRPLELEMQQAELSEKQADDQLELGTKKLKIDEKKASQPAASSSSGSKAKSKAKKK